MPQAQRVAHLVHGHVEQIGLHEGFGLGAVGVDLASGELPVLLNGSVATSQSPAMRDALTAELRR